MTFLRARDTFGTSSISRKTLTLTGFFFRFLRILVVLNGTCMWECSCCFFFLSFLVLSSEHCALFDRQWKVFVGVNSRKMFTGIPNRIPFHSSVRHAATDWTAYIKLLIPNVYTHSLTQNKQLFPLTMSMRSISILFSFCSHSIRRYSISFFFSFVRSYSLLTRNLEGFVLSFIIWYYFVDIGFDLDGILFSTWLTTTVALKWFIFSMLFVICHAGKKGKHRWENMKQRVK